MGRAQRKMFDKCSEIAHILGNAALSRRSFALAVTSSIVRNDTEGACQRGNDGIPGVVVYPRAVDEHKRIARLSGALPVEANAVDRCRRQKEPPHEGVFAQGTKPFTVRPSLYTTWCR